MYNDVIQLVRKETTKDAYGDRQTVEVAREVFAEYVSISQSEFYQAAATGLKPELRFRLADYYDYDGEPIVNYHGERYRVLRTYRSGQGIELTVYKEVNSP